MSVLRKARIAAGLATAAAVLTITDVVSQAGQTGRPQSANPALAHRRGPVGVAAAYGYPARCVSVTISTDDPAYARADFNRTSPCGRYDGGVTAIFNRTEDGWRPVLVAVNYSCPMALLPAVVQIQLDVCPQVPRFATRRAARRWDR